MFWKCEFHGLFFLSPSRGGYSPIKMPTKSNFVGVPSNSFTPLRGTNFEMTIDRHPLRPLKGTEATLSAVILDFGTLRGTNSQILTPKRCEKVRRAPRHYYRGVLPGLLL